MNTKWERYETIEKYVEGATYDGKGVYLGVSKGAHKFQRHTKPFFQRDQHGPKYFFEKV